MATSAQYAATPATAFVQISTANTNRDGTGTLGTLITAPSAGTRVDDIQITAAGTTTAGVVRMFLSNGTSHHLMAEYIVAATTPSTSVPVWSTKLTNLGIILKNGWSLRFSTHNAETFNVAMLRGGDFT